MSMTAAELWEVVKDVPSEAWPNNLVYHIYPVFNSTETVYVWAIKNAWQVSAEHAELMFEASMVRWLYTHSNLGLAIEPDGEVIMVKVKRFGPNGQVVDTGMPFIVALAATCKSVAGEGGTNAT